MSLTLAKSKFERRFCLDLLTGSQGVKVNLLDKHSRLFAIFSKVALFHRFFFLWQRKLLFNLQKVALITLVKTMPFFPHLTIAAIASTKKWCLLLLIHIQKWRKCYHDFIQKI